MTLEGGTGSPPIPEVDVQIIDARTHSQNVQFEIPGAGVLFGSYASPDAETKVINTTLEISHPAVQDVINNRITYEKETIAEGRKRTIRERGRAAVAIGTISTITLLFGGLALSDSTPESHPSFLAFLASAEVLTVGAFAGGARSQRRRIEREQIMPAQQRLAALSLMRSHIPEHDRVKPVISERT